MQLLRNELLVPSFWERVTCIGGFAAWILWSELHSLCSFAGFTDGDTEVLRVSVDSLKLLSQTMAQVPLGSRVLYSGMEAFLPYKASSEEGRTRFCPFHLKCLPVLPPWSPERGSESGWTESGRATTVSSHSPQDSSSSFRTPGLSQEPWMDRTLISGNLKLQVRWSFGMRLEGAASGEPQGAGCHSLTGLRVLTLLHHLNSCFADAQVHALSSAQSNT